MIRLGLRLSVGSGRDARSRVMVVAGAVALGVGLLLSALAGVNGLRAQSARGAWLDTAAQTQRGSVTASAPDLWWLSSVDQYGGRAIDRVDVAAGGRNAPVPPGLARDPGPGQYYVSPALSALLQTVPADELRDRYPGRQAGLIGPGGLPSPNSLIVVVGHRARWLSRIPGAVEVSAVQRAPASCYNCANDVGSGSILEWVLAVGAVTLLLPVLILIATASRLSAARREERFAAMRLVGATPRQISLVAAVEAAIASLVGVVAGFVLFYASRSLLYRVPFTGSPLAAGDLSLSPADIVFALVGVPGAAVVSARLALRRVQVSPLGVTRQAGALSPRIYRVLPLLTGVALLAYFDAAGKPGAVGGQLLELLAGFTLLVVGLVLAGPWLVVVGARALTRWAARPSALIAGRRMLHNPKTSFRFIAGLVVALFISSALVGTLSSVDVASATTSSNSGLGTLADTFCSFSRSNCPASAIVASVPGRSVRGLRAIRGVSAVTVIHQPPTLRQLGSTFGVVECAQLGGTPAIGHCAQGETSASVGYFLSAILGHSSHAATTTWPSAHLSSAAVAALPVDAIVVATDGSSSSLERVRTALERMFPLQGAVVSVDSLDAKTQRLLAMIQDMIDIVIVASLVIAACSLAVNVVAGLDERKRPFSLLRLTGFPVSLLKRVVVLETVLPLVAVAVVSVAVGLVSSALYLHSQVGLAFRVPGVGYWSMIVGGLAASLAVVASVFPVLDRVTGPETARNA